METQDWVPGRGMIYCKKHMFWRPSGTKCSECEEELTSAIA